MKFIVYCFLILFSLNGFGQKSNLINDLFFYGDVMINAIEYQNRAKAGDLFHKAFIDFLNEPNAFDLSSGDIKTISVLEDEEGSFKLVSWQVKHLENKSQYHAFVLFPDGQFIELKDNSNFTQDLAYESITPESWYGALYYNIKKIDNSKYLIFGYNQIDQFTSAKVVDLITVKNKTITLGEEIFEEKKDLDTYKNRIVLTYSGDASVNLNFNPGLDMIVHDHLTQRMGQLEGQGPTNVPDGTYEGYKMENGKWMYKEKLYNHSYGENNAPIPNPVISKKKKGLFGK